MEPEVVVASRCLLGEAPTWHDDENRVYWTDIRNRQLHRFHPDSGAHETVLNERLIGAITLERDGSLLLLGRWGAVHRYRDGSASAVRRIDWRHLGFRFNDAIADPAGRVFAGIMAYDADVWRLPGTRTIRRGLRSLGLSRIAGQQRGALCRLGGGGRIVLLGIGVGRPNGMGFSPDLNWLYVTDSYARRIYAYRYDVDRGLLTDPRLFLDLSSEPGVPDGLVVDVEGCIWSVRHKAGEVVRYAPNGREVARVRFPTPAITSLAFGGPDKTHLYVTAGGADDPSRNGALAGAMFRLQSPVAGGPVWRSSMSHD